jgi:exosortase/archaeosortase family protein
MIGGSTGVGAQRPPIFQTAHSLLWTSGPYVCLVLLLTSVLHEPSVEAALLVPFRTTVAWAARGALTLLGIAAAGQGTHILAPHLSVNIVDECTGLEATVLLVPAILVFPAPWRTKGLGLVLSLGVMAAVNFVRVVSLCYVGTYSATLLRLGHLYVWPTAVIITGLATLLFWAERIVVPPHR